MMRPRQMTPLIAALGAVALLGCVDTDAPSWAPGELAFEGEPSSREVVWPSASDPSGVAAYLVRIDGEPAARLDPGTHRYAIDELDEVSDHTIEIVAVDPAGNESGALRVTRTGDHTAPSFGAGSLQATASTDQTTTSVRLAWPVAEDEVGVTAYVLRIDGEEVRRLEPSELQAAPAATLSDVDLAQPRTFAVVAVDRAGNESDVLSTRDARAPTFPEGAEIERSQSGPARARVVSLRWPAATDDVAVTAYVVRRGSEELARLGPRVLEYELGEEASVPSNVAVVAVDAAGREALLNYPNARLAVEEAQAEIEQMLLGALGGDGATLQDVLRGGSVRDLDDAMMNTPGVGVAQRFPQERGGGGRVGGLGSIRPKPGGLAERGPPAARTRGRVTIGGVESSTGPGVFSTDTVLGLLRRRVRAVQTCYERELRSTPTISGRVLLSLTIDPSGRTRAQAAGNTTGSPATESCAVRTAARLRFNPGPEGGNFTVRVGLVFTPEPAR